jgi:hypothetical protein
MKTFDYDFINRYNSHIKPSTVHTQENVTTWYFRRYLIQKILSVFEFEGIPETWDKDYFLYGLFLGGFVGVVETDKFGIIPQAGNFNCSLAGVNVFYRPTYIVITNHLLRGILRPRIGVECELIKMQPDYGSCWDIVTYYADLLSLATESLAVNIVNSKLAYVFACDSKNVAESFKKMFDRINDGNPAVFADSKLFDESGEPLWTTFQNNLKQNYVAGDMLDDMLKIDARFCTEIGIPNVNMAKASGVTDDEVQANNIDTKSKVSLWLETIREGLDKVNEMFDLNLSVKLRFERGENDVVIDSRNI